ncbi:expressed protein [Phakopsora pachyrhizi]|uniref:Expressed protein n=1 Tax=Phakopsora pachyrhizi TaxID=170000 RepID=A0AAV0BEP4_PHAPC|nr:expressed protein [Phakopsora pachyrhizi]
MQDFVMRTTAIFTNHQIFNQEEILTLFKEKSFIHFFAKSFHLKVRQDPLESLLWYSYRFVIYQFFRKDEVEKAIPRDPLILDRLLHEFVTLELGLLKENLKGVKDNEFMPLQEVSLSSVLDKKCSEQIESALLMILNSSSEEKTLTTEQYLTVYHLLHYVIDSKKQAEVTLEDEKHNNFMFINTILKFYSIAILNKETNELTAGTMRLQLFHNLKFIGHPQKSQQKLDVQTEQFSPSPGALSIAKLLKDKIKPSEEQNIILIKRNF